MATRRSLTTGMSGSSGEYFVAAQLSRLGYIATLTLKNARGIDILASNADASRSVGIQVKTNQGTAKEWVLTQKAEGYTAANLFFVFVNLNGPAIMPTFHIVPSRVVADFIRTSHAAWLKVLGRGGRPHKDTQMRKFYDKEDKYLSRWDLLRLGRPPA